MTRSDSRRGAFRPTQRRVKLYHQARTVHLERALVDADVTLLYSAQRYDFDGDVGSRSDVRQTGDLAAAWLIARSRPTLLEVTEPAYLPGVRRAALAVAAVQVATLLTRRGRPTIVTYAIANSDPRREWVARGPRHRLVRSATIALSRWLHSRCDRVAFGTAASAELYRHLFRLRRRQERALIPALPDACRCGPLDRPRAHSLVFVGAFVERKGFPALLDAWPTVAAALPDATLHLLGMGALLGHAQRLADLDDRVVLDQAPARELIHQVLRRTSVLVLPSAPMPTWREQIGLPVLEGLEHGCTIVTTTETGLADWLASHGHRVVDSSADARTLADALIDALRHPLDPAQVLRDLPSRDGREAAEAWLHRT